MHSPTHCVGPAASARAQERLRAIQDAACRLVIDRGYDGFTMDELAEVVGISRRTLFNYVSDKPSAVLGTFAPEQHGGEILERFRRGGPTGDLVQDLHASIDAFVSEVGDPDGDRELQQRVDAAVAADPKVLSIAITRFEHVTELLEQAVVERQHWDPDDLRARVLAATTLALIKVTLTEVTHQDGASTDFRSAFHAVLAAHAALSTTT